MESGKISPYVFLGKWTLAQNAFKWWPILYYDFEVWMILLLTLLSFLLWDLGILFTLLDSSFFNFFNGQTLSPMRIKAWVAINDNKYIEKLHL